MYVTAISLKSKCHQRALTQWVRVKCVLFVYTLRINTRLTSAHFANFDSNGSRGAARGDRLRQPPNSHCHAQLWCGNRNIWNTCALIYTWSILMQSADETWGRDLISNPLPVLTHRVYGIAMCAGFKQCANCRLFVCMGTPAKGNVPQAMTIIWHNLFFIYQIYTTPKIDMFDNGITCYNEKHTINICTECFCN